MERKDYVLGTEKKELHRLGIQHQVWSAEARKAWEIAEFGPGQTILDLGCGPGFCSTELAYLVGNEGKVIGIDLSQKYIDFLGQQAEIHGLNIDAICASFDEMDLKDNSLDGVYDRWGLTWVTNPEEIIEKIVKAMAPGGVFIAHEYYDWRTFQTEPNFPALSHAIQAAFKSLNDTSGNLNIGRRLPEMFYNAGLEVTSIRPLMKLATPDNLTWEWPNSFLQIYLPKLIPDYLSAEEVENALLDMEDLMDIDGATLFCPTMVEVVAAKI